MEIESSRQIPSSNWIVKEKDYCDLVYAWVQCHSQRMSLDSQQRRIAKKDIKWTKIETDFTRTGLDGKPEKIIGRKTIAKYFVHLVEKGLIEEGEDEYYYIRLLSREDANLIEYQTLSKLLNVFQKDSLSIYVYLYNRFVANSYEPFIVTAKQVKEFLGRATNTTSNNGVVSDTVEILERLGLLKTEMIFEDNKSYTQVLWVKNRLS